jgi:hypothetical protein
MRRILESIEPLFMYFITSGRMSVRELMAFGDKKKMITPPTPRQPFPVPLF